MHFQWPARPAQAAPIRLPRRHAPRQRPALWRTTGRFWPPPYPWPLARRYARFATKPIFLEESNRWQLLAVFLRHLLLLLACYSRARKHRDSLGVSLSVRKRAA